MSNMNDLPARLATTNEAAERLNVSSGDIAKRGTEIAQTIRTTEIKLADLQRDIASLTEKRAEAIEASNGLTAAEREAKAAQQAFETQQADAFIDGRPFDAAPYKARCSKAGKRLEEARSTAMTSRAAIPRIDARLAGLQDEHAALSETLKVSIALYWDNRQRGLEVEYLTHVCGMLDCLQTFAALDIHTSTGIGSRLIREMRRGIYAPLDGRHVEVINTAAWFGHSVIPDVSPALARLAAELQALTGEGI